MAVDLYDDADNLIHTFLETSTSNGYYYNTNPVSITPAIYENPGMYYLTFYSSDADNVPSIMTIELAVNSAPAINHAPIITSTPIVIVNEGLPYTYDVSATDSDNDTLTYSLSQKPSWLSINSTTGLISGTAPSVIANTPNTIVVSVSDGTNVVSQTYTLTIIETSTIPDTTSPVITLTGSNPQIVEQGNVYTEFGATAFDNINGNLTSLITINSSAVNTLLLGTYPVNYSVSDNAGNIGTATRWVNVVDTTAPLIDTISDDSITENKNYEYQVEATDLNSLSYSISGASWLSINLAGLISGTAPSVSSNEDYDITVEVTDLSGNSNSQIYTLTVNNKKSSSGSGGAVISTISPTKPTESTIITPTSNIELSPQKKSSAFLPLYIVMIATTSLGIILVSYILIKRIKNRKWTRH